MGTFGSTFGRSYSYGGAIIPPPPTGLAPEITGETETFLSNNRVGISASINPNGETTLIVLEYGLTTSYGTTVVIDNLVGNSPIPISTIIPRLTPDNYHYRIVATNAVGTDTGDDQEFTIYTGVGRDLIDYTDDLNATIATMTGTTYYIDPTAGSNGNGLTDSTPFDSWTRIASLGNGNIYLQKRGTTYTSATNTIPTINGRCMIGAYGSGTGRAKIVQGASGNFITTNYQTIIKDIHVEGFVKTPGYEAGNGIALGHTSNAQDVNHWIYNCIVEYFDTGIGTVSSSNQYWSNIKILHNIVRNIRLDGIYLNGTTDFDLGYNYVYNVNNAYFINVDDGTSRGDGVQIEFRNQYLPTIRMTGEFHHNTIDRTSTGNKFCLIWNSFENNEDMVVYNNHFIAPAITVFPGRPTSCVYASMPAGTQPYSTKVDDTNTVVVYNNIFEGGENGFKNIVVNGSRFYYNLFLNNNTGFASGPWRDVELYNNVFKDYLTVAIGMNNTNETIIKNNVFDGAVGSPLAFSGIVGLNASDYNHFYRGRVASTGSTLTAWKAASVFDDNSTEGDPEFTDAVNYDFSIGTGSPLKDSGTLVSLTEDFFGNAVPFNTVPDKGIYEFST